MKKKNTQLVSIIIPTLNSENSIKQCLDSIKEQTYKHIEVIVVDNSSTDNTVAIAKRYITKVLNKGPERSAQRNFGAKNTRGDHLLFIDSDMILSSKVVESCVNLLKKDKAIGGVVIPERSVGAGFWSKCKGLEKELYEGIEWIESARFYKRKIFEKVGGYDTDLISAEDWDLSQRVGKLLKIGRINKYIYHNEGRITFTGNLKKKYYYATKVHKYFEKKNNSQENLKMQSSILERYKIYLLRPRKLFKEPTVGIGLLCMKLCEFSVGGAGYIIRKYNLK